MRKTTKKSNSKKDEEMLIEALELVSKEKGLDKELIFETIEISLLSACKKNFGSSQNISVNISREDGSVKVLAKKEIVEVVKNENFEISLEEAKKINLAYDIGDFLNVVVTPKDFGRISTQTAKQIVVQKFREAERNMLYNQYFKKENQVMTGIVQRKEHGDVVVSLDKIDAVLSEKDCMPNETYEFNKRIKVYVLEVKQTPKSTIMRVSRTKPELVNKLFEQEVPEIYEGIIKIKSTVREAGNRTKISVISTNKDIDPVGACVGQNGMRVNVIVDELNGEKIDIIEYHEDITEYVLRALSPSKVTSVTLNEEENIVTAIVPDNQLSLAIGKEGQNVRLAAKLTNIKIDIKSESESMQTEI